MCWWTWNAFGIITFWGIIGHVASEVTVCSEYLVSGLYGVEESALTSSSYYLQRFQVYGPPNARLHFEGPHGVCSAWASGINNDQQYIQVRLPRETVVDTIMIQGRHDFAQWVKSFYVLYSLDGVTWVTVMSENKTPKLFTGNSDMNTVVKSSLVPGITAVYIRINPRSWNQQISLRFDVSGCYKEKGRSEFYRVPLLPSSNVNVVFESESPSPPVCGQLCHNEDTCLSFTFDTDQKICRGYKSPVNAQYTTFSKESTQYFVNKGAYTSLGYQSYQNFSDGFTFYKVNEVSLNQTAAADVCNQQYSILFKIQTKPEMSILQSIIAGNTILLKDHNQLFVSGMYVSTKWKYNDAAEITDNSLWSPDNPDPSQGHCVMLTQTGLASVNCSQSLFSICEPSFYP